MSGLSAMSDEELDTFLDQLTKRTCGNSESRESLDVKTLVDVVDSLEGRVDKLEDTPSLMAVTTQGFRFLRNATAACKRNQDLLREGTKVVEVVGRILGSFGGRVSFEGSSRPLTESESLLVRCAFQFVVNFVVDNPENANLCFEMLTSHLEYLLKMPFDDEKIVDYSAMTFHTVFRTNSTLLPGLNSELVSAALKHTHLEYVMYFLETVTNSEAFMLQGFVQMPVDDRVKLIQVLVAHEKFHTELQNPILSFFSVQFQEKSDLILKSSLAKDEGSCWEIVSLLQLLYHLSSLESTVLREDTPLLITAIFLLRSAHSATDSDFAPVKGLDMFNVGPKSEELRSNPTFQFKANLIRLIANLIYRNFKHQELLRETEGLAVILDNCKLDARNPFITQCAVLAIRNACEGNQANQDVVQSIERVDTAEALSKVQVIEL